MLPWLPALVGSFAVVVAMVRMGAAFAEPPRRRAAYAIAAHTAALAVAGALRGTAWELPASWVAGVYLAGHAGMLHRQTRALAQAAEERAEGLAVDRVRALLAGLEARHGG